MDLAASPRGGEAAEDRKVVQLGDRDGGEAETGRTLLRAVDELREDPFLRWP
jgi:hypothetical protein